jgi:hypothetical protein
MVNRSVLKCSSSVKLLFMAGLWLEFCLDYVHFWKRDEDQHSYHSE